MSTSIQLTHLQHALAEFGRMDLAQRVRVADEIFERQPNLLASVLVLKKMGASDAQLEVALQALLMTWLAMRQSGRSWPLITEAVQEACLQRLTGRMRFIEGLPAEQVQRALQDQIDAHGERNMLAFAFAHLGDAGLLGIRTDAEKFVVLAVLNLVECIASDVAAKRARARTHPPGSSN